MAKLSEALALAMSHWQAGRPDQAEAVFRAIVAAAPDHVASLQFLGSLACQRNELAEAIDLFSRAAAAAPEDADAHSNLGVALHRQGRLAEAEASLRRALEIAPQGAQSLLNLAAVLNDLGRLDEAEELCSQALTQAPQMADAHFVAGTLATARGDHARSAGEYAAAVRLDPNLADAWFNLANALGEQGRLGQGVAAFRRALEIRPGDPRFLMNLGCVLRSLGHDRQAVACFEQARAIKPSDLVRYEIAITLPVIYSSEEEIQQTRRRLIGDLDALVREGVRLDPATTRLNGLFSLAYQGLNDRPIHAAVGRLLSAEAGVESAPSPAPRAAIRADRRTAVGFLSRHFRDHTIAWLWEGIIAGLPRDEFAVTLLSLGMHRDAVAERLKREVDRCVILPEDRRAARKMVAELGLDVLIYTDVGMDPATTALAAARLAPVQAATWGHPVTTGLPSIDYFLSSSLMEPADAANHYTERLVRMQTLGLCLERPWLTAPKSRIELGPLEDRHLYACLQSLFKLHPDFDPLLGQILRRDPQGELLLLTGPQESWKEKLCARLSRTIPDVLDRVRFLPELNGEDYLAACAVADVVLDPLHFGGGRTSFEALAMGTPVVTLPSGLLRGRITYAAYQAMGVQDWIAGSPDEYVEIALRLATNPDLRQSARERLLTSVGVLFDDRRAIAEWSEWLRSAVSPRP